MTRRMLINATHEEECRIAIADEDHLLELEIENSTQRQLKGNIYKATITRVEPSLQAAFLDIGSNRNGFLQINDIHPTYFKDWPPLEKKGKSLKPSIQDVLKAGTDLIVQVAKDEREAKGATLTTNLSIPGRFLVLMVGSQRGGVSRKINDAGQRSRLKEVVQSLKVPPGVSVIVRTAGINKAASELQADLDNLLETWSTIVQQTLKRAPTPVPLFEESTLAIRTIRDFLTPSIDEIQIDKKEVHENVKSFVEENVPAFADKIHYYDDSIPLLSKYMLDSQIEAIDSPTVTLPSGGSIVIDTTEAIVAIDVNSGRSTSQADVEETAYETNKEAAREIATQLRLRDLGGLVVIDFIDMNDKKHRLVVEKTLKDSLRQDKAKVEISRISKFGLLEMSRQRLKSSISSQRYSSCPTCDGRGRIKTAKSSALEALRKIESTAFSGGIRKILIRLSPSAALFLLNEKRYDLVELERLTNTTIAVHADGRLHQHEYELEVSRESSEVTTVTNVTKSASGQHSGNKDKDYKKRRKQNPKKRRQNNRRGPRRNTDSRSSDSSKRSSKPNKPSTQAKEVSPKKESSAPNKEKEAPSTSAASQPTS